MYPTNCYSGWRSGPWAYNDFRNNSVLLYFVCVYSMRMNSTSELSHSLVLSWFKLSQSSHQSNFFHNKSPFSIFVTVFFIHKPKEILIFKQKIFLPIYIVSYLVYKNPFPVFFALLTFHVIFPNCLKSWHYRVNTRRQLKWCAREK